MVGTKVYNTAFSGTLSSGGLLHSDWLPPNRVTAHYHKVDLISTLLDALTPHSHGASASTPTPLIDFEWSDVKRCQTELWVHRIASLALLAAEVENFSTFQAPTKASANQIALCKYPSAEASQSRSCNTRKVCDWLLSL